MESSRSWDSLDKYSNISNYWIIGHAIIYTHFVLKNYKSKQTLF